MVFNTTFNNISVISWLSVLLVEETGVPGENLSQFTDKLYHIIKRHNSGTIEAYYSLHFSMENFKFMVYRK
jgi:hypothetical protein